MLGANLGSTVSDIFLWVVVLAFLSCGAAVQAAATRVFYSYARDGMIFGHKWLKKVSPRFQTPTNALIVSAIVSLLVSLSARFESILTSFAVVGIYAAFQSIIVAWLIARARRFRAPKDGFNMGNIGSIIAILGLVYGVGMIVNLVRPISPTAPWYVDYEVLLATLAVLLLGVIVYLAGGIGKRIKADKQLATATDSAAGLDA